MLCNTLGHSILHLVIVFFLLIRPGRGNNNYVIGSMYKYNIPGVHELMDAASSVAMHTSCTCPLAIYYKEKASGCA